MNIFTNYIFYLKIQNIIHMDNIGKYQTQKMENQQSLYRTYYKPDRIQSCIKKPPLYCKSIFRSDHSKRLNVSLGERYYQSNDAKTLLDTSSKKYKQLDKGCREEGKISDWLGQKQFLTNAPPSRATTERSSQQKETIIHEKKLLYIPKLLKNELTEDEQDDKQYWKKLQPTIFRHANSQRYEKDKKRRKNDFRDCDNFRRGAQSQLNKMEKIQRDQEKSALKQIVGITQNHLKRGWTSGQKQMKEERQMPKNILKHRRLATTLQEFQEDESENQRKGCQSPSGRYKFADRKYQTGQISICRQTGSRIQIKAQSKIQQEIRQEKKEIQRYIQAENRNLKEHNQFLVQTIKKMRERERNQKILLKIYKGEIQNLGKKLSCYKEYCQYLKQRKVEQATDESQDKIMMKQISILSIDNEDLIYTGTKGESIQNDVPEREYKEQNNESEEKTNQKFSSKDSIETKEGPHRNSTLQSNSSEQPRLIESKQLNIDGQMLENDKLMGSTEIQRIRYGKQLGKNDRKGQLNSFYFEQDEQQTPRFRLKPNHRSEDMDTNKVEALSQDKRLIKDKKKQDVYQQIQKSQGLLTNEVKIQIFQGIEI